MQELPAAVGTELANWNWKVVSQYASERFGISLSRSTCLNYLHRLGFVLKHPKKRLVKADDTKRESFVADYAAPWDEAHRSGAKIFFAYEAHFRADAELRGKWVLKGEPAPVFTGAGFGGLQQPALWREGQLLLGGLPGDRRGGVDGTGGEQQLRNIGRVPEAIEREALWAAERHLGQRSGAPWRGGAGVSPGAGPGPAADEPPFSRGQALPGYSPDFNADEAIWGWAREEATGNLCLGSKALVQERVSRFLSELARRKHEVKRRCRTILQPRAERLLRDSQPSCQPPANAHPTLALV